MAEINRSCEGESEKVSGKEPTVKDLDPSSIGSISLELVRCGYDQWELAVRSPHPTAITELKLSKVKRPSIVLLCRRTDVSL